MFQVSFRAAWPLLLLACTAGDDGPSTEDTVPTDVTDSDTGTTMVEDLTPFSSGTRLQATYLEGGSADSQVFEHWVDTDLGIECTVASDETGTLRCFPSEYGQFVYADAGCTEPLFAWRSCDKSAPPPFLAGSLPDRCIGLISARGYEVGTTVQRDHVYEGADCTRTDFDGDRTYYTATLRPSTDFAELTSRSVPIGDGLGVEVRETAGGAHRLANLVATGSDQRCFPVSLGADFDQYCLHGDFAYDFGGLYADAACEGDSLAYAIGAASCDPPAYALTYSQQGACSVWTGELADIGAPVDASEVYASTGDTCTAVTEDSRSYYAVGAAAAGTPLPALDTAPFGAARLQPHMFATSSGDALTPSAALWTDTDLGKECSAYATESDGIRCLPGLVTTDSRFGTFADKACTQRVIARNTDPCFSAPLPELVGIDTGGPCGSGPLEEVRSVGAEYVGDLYRKNESTCTPTTANESNAYYRVGELVALDGYAAITRQSAR